MIELEECLVTYGAAWFERDPARRVELLRQCCTEDIVFVDPTLGKLHGLDAVSEMIAGYMTLGLADASTAAVSEPRERGRTGNGTSVDVVTGVEELHGFFRYSFVWTLPDGTTSGGTDFCERAADGRMKLITVWPATDDFPVPART